MQLHEQLEKSFGEWIGWRNVVACSSGTAALHLALESLQMPPDSEVVVPEFTMIACARAVTLAGLKPVFVDCKDDLTMDPKLLEKAVTKNTKAVMPVHIYGRLCDMKAIGKIADRHGLHVVEDAAESHGAKHNYISDAICWSFYRNKIVGGAEGGAVAFLRKDHADKARWLRNMGSTELNNFLHEPRGHNYRMSDLHAADILNSLADVDRNIQKRRQVEHVYRNAINRAGLEHCKMPIRDVVWVYDIQLPNGNNQKIVDYLNAQGVAARVSFRPMSQQQEYKQPYRHLNAYRLSREIIYLPVTPWMEDVEANRNVYFLTEAVNKAGK